MAIARVKVGTLNVFSLRVVSKFHAEERGSLGVRHRDSLCMLWLN